MYTMYFVSYLLNLISLHFSHVKIAQLTYAFSFKTFTV